MQALEEAKQLWNSPELLIQMWLNDPHKIRHEHIISKHIGRSGYVVDLGCGVGRFTQVLKCAKYQGYDQSPAMIKYAKEYIRLAKANFATVDIFKFISDEEYDTLIMIDVAQHQDDPLQAISLILNRWRAKRYFFTLLAGNKDEQLLNSFIVDREKVKNFTRENNLEICYNEQNEFDWLILSSDSK